MLSEVVDTKDFSPLSHLVVNEGYPGSDSPKSGLLSTIKVGGVHAKSELIGHRFRCAV